MCKCTKADNLYQDSKEHSLPYCGKENCKPPKEWLKFSKKCPWLFFKELWRKQKAPLCRGTLDDDFRDCWSVGDFSHHYCSAENCAPFYFATKYKRESGDGS